MQLVQHLHTVVELLDKQREQQTLYNAQTLAMLKQQHKGAILMQVGLLGTSIHKIQLLQTALTMEVSMQQVWVKTLHLVVGLLDLLWQN